ncbi:MAG: preprotein translocase subunit SecG [Victivallales bacterium]|nr:preprotein translocase subunit SecG [Victivallales bacterium]
MGVVSVVLYTLVIIVALLLIGLVLIQQSKGGGFGGSFGGVGESVFGAHAGSHLTKLTVILTTSFFVLTLLLAVIVGHRSRGRSIVESEDVKSIAITKKTPLSTAKVKLTKNLKTVEKSKPVENKK